MVLALLSGLVEWGGLGSNNFDEDIDGLLRL